jgi:Spy/CpxP family protein refolding chaperone
MSSGESTTWQNPKVLTTLLLVFIAGAFAGALSMRLGLHERMHHSASTLNNPNTSKVFLERCTKELNLTPEQARQMSLILDDYKQYYQSVQDQFDEVRSTGKNRILQVLDDQQKQKFEKILSEMK